MIARTQHGRTRTLLSLKQGVVGLAALYLAIVLFLLAQIMLKGNEASAAEHQVKTERQQVFNTQAEISRANRLTHINAPSDLGAVAKLQSTVEKLAGEQHCSVAEFRASSETLPYLTRFAKTTDVSGWTQVQAQMSLAGSVHEVMGTLTGLIQSGIPFEFDSMEINRDKVDSVGDAKVLAHVTLRVLIRMKEAA